jgi:hypothetical protein
MSEENPQTHNPQTQTRCAFCEVSETMGRFMQSFGPSENVKSHFRQSRVEFLKGIRAVLDERIENMGRPRKGTRVVVE